MADPRGTIDLGELPAGEPREIDAPWPVTQRLRHWHGHRPGRLVAVAAAAALLLTTASAAASPPQPPLTRLFSVQAEEFALDRQNLYTLHGDGPGTTVAAHRLADGARQWEVSLPGSSTVRSLFATGGALVVMATAGELSTIVLDPDSGGQIWTGQGLLSGSTDELLVFRRDLITRDADPAEGVTRQFTVVDRATGRDWNRSVTGGDFSVAGSSRLVTLDPVGHLTTRDLRTDQLLASAPERVPGGGQLQVAGSLALVTYSVRGERSVTAYDVDSLTRRWTVDVDPRGIGLLATTCEGLVCLHGQHRVLAIDPASGEPAWSPDWLAAGSGDGWFTVLDLDIPQLDGYLVLIHSPDGGDDQASWLVDATTGEPVLDLHGWQLAGDAGPAGRVPATWRPGDRGPTWIGRLRPDLSGIDPLAAVPGPAPPPCQLRTPYVVCVDPLPDGPGPLEVAVWRARR